MDSPDSSYDVVIVGAQIGPLISGALLAKRGFRVLVIGQDCPPATYRIGPELSLPRMPFNFHCSKTPIVRKIMGELALQQVLRRRAHPQDPAFQVVIPQHRFDWATDPTFLEREFEREFPEIKRPAEDFLVENERNNKIFDALFTRNLAWPPQSFLEKREFARATAEHPFGRQGDDLDPLRTFPEDHPFRLTVSLASRFNDFMDPDHLSGLQVSRHFHSWQQGSTTLDDGMNGLRELLINSIKTQSGTVRERERIDQIVTRRNATTGVRIAASGESIGASSVVFGSRLSELMRLVADRAPFEELFERLGEPVVRYYRYTLNLVVRREAVPNGMSEHVFYVRDPRRPLNDVNALRIQIVPLPSEAQRLICVQALLPRRATENVSDYFGSIRQRIMDSLSSIIPFLQKKLILVDSPHDGRPPEVFDATCEITPPDRWWRGPQTMPTVHGFPVTRGLGLCALSPRTPFKRLYLCNSQVVPGLGLEGEFVAGHSIAGMITRTDGRRDWLRRGRWGKLDV